MRQSFDAMAFEAVVFDLDGTLVDTAHDLHGSLNHVLAEAGRQPVPIAAVRQLVGDGARRMIERGFEMTGPALAEAALEDAVAAFLVHYQDHLADASIPFPGAVACLERIAAAGVRLGVCTNKRESFSVALLDALGLSGHFGAVVGGDSLSMRKPDGGHITGTLGAMGHDGGPAAMIGDTVTDVTAARDAGLPVVAVSFGYGATPAAEIGADAVIDHFDELDAALASLRGA